MPSNVGVISDTHGLLRPEAIEFLKGCDLIVHAGDIGSPEILEKLRAVAPTFPVRGNMDRGPWAGDLPITEVIEAGGRFLYLIHNLVEMDLDPAASGFDAVISGHSHQPQSRIKGGVLYFNPGSAGPRRFRTPVSMGRIVVGDAGIESEIIPLPTG